MNEKAQQVDPLSKPACDILTPHIVALPCAHEPDLFFDGDRFMRHLSRTYCHFDVATYSVSKARLAPLTRINRLIYGIRQTNISVKPKHKKFIMNNHVKMFICYSYDGDGIQGAGITTDVYLGSQNLTYGTNLNIMVKAQTQHVVPLIQFFNLLWDSK